MKLMTMVAFTLAVASACAGRAAVEAPAPPAPPARPAPLDPVGVYSFSTIYQGEPMTGRIVIEGAAGSYTGMVEPSAGPPPVEIYSVTVEGQELRIFADAGGEDLMMTMTFTGDSYTGSWILGFDSGEMTGTRIQQ